MADPGVAQLPALVLCLLSRDMQQFPALISKYPEPHITPLAPLLSIHNPFCASHFRIDCPHRPPALHCSPRRHIGLSSSVYYLLGDIGTVMAKKRQFIPNQVFVGLPWKTVRPKYLRVIDKLSKRYPLYFTIVGRDDGQDAKALFEVIKERIGASSHAVFDATGGNANVSLEFGYAEGIEVPRSIFLSDHKASAKDASSPIISDLTGMRRVHYKTEKRLAAEMDKLSKEHDYTKRFEKALSAALKGKSKGEKKSGRALALKLVRALNGKTKMRRAELVQHGQAEGYGEAEIDKILKKLHASGVLKCTVGKYSEAYVA